ncbi:MAG: LuxR C-terminal-related transcriptional regulator [Candidatus Gastranaerophilaceae bacterium]|nr:LuxR C-terminal-related transcriptional regulator [Candidatus Gastranaerophilaceae bacterium]
MNTEVKILPIRPYLKDNCILTHRELEYLALVALGCRNNEIANILYVSLCTVKKTFEKIFDKLHAIDRASAVKIGFINHILNTRVLTEAVKTYEINTVVVMYL